MSLVAMGLNHGTGSVELRERLAFRQTEIPRALHDFRQRCEDAGVVILSTCNRVELYIHHPDLSEGELLDLGVQFLSDWHDVPSSDFRPALYEYDGVEAAGHLFRVAASLDSLVMGEAQILGQVHDAYLLTQEEQAGDKVIHALFQRAFSVAKSVRTRTEVGAGNISISSVAVDLAASIFMDFQDKTVMVIGAGEMSELTLKTIVSRGVGEVLVVNRNMDRARRIAETYGGEAISFDDLEPNLHRGDILITSTAASHTVLHAAHFKNSLPRRNREPVFVIDIAVPRDVDSDVGAIDNVYLYNIDDLRKVVEENLETRRVEADKGLEIVEHGAEQFGYWLRGIAAEPTIASMAREVRAVQEEELQKTLDALPGLTEEQREEIRYLTERIVKKILRSPMTQIKHEIGHHDPRTVLHLAQRLFGLGESSR